MEASIGSTKLKIDEIFRSNPHVHRVAFDIILDAANKIGFKPLVGEIEITSSLERHRQHAERVVGWCRPDGFQKAKITILTQTLIYLTAQSPHQMDPIKSFAFTVVHELTHAHQFLRGDLSHSYDMRTNSWYHVWQNRWYGEKYSYDKSPWEVEANQIAQEITGFKRPSFSKLFTQEDFKITPRS